MRSCAVKLLLVLSLDLEQVAATYEGVKYLRVLFMSKGKREDRCRIGSDAVVV